MWNNLQSNWIQSKDVSEHSVDWWINHRHVFFIVGSSEGERMGLLRCLDASLKRCLNTAEPKATVAPNTLLRCFNTQDMPHIPHEGRRGARSQSQTKPWTQLCDGTWWQNPELTAVIWKKKNKTKTVTEEVVNYGRKLEEKMWNKHFVFGLWKIPEYIWWHKSLGSQGLFYSVLFLRRLSLSANSALSVFASAAKLCTR